MIYRIADVNIEINPKYEFTKNYIADYITDGTPQFTVEITQSDIEKEKMFTKGLEEHYYEITAILRKICIEMLRNYDGLFFHCSCLDLDGKAYIFTAPSGTGKSTHTRLWKEYFGDRVTMINDDKPILRFIDGKFYAYGTPWNGKHNISTNIKSPVHAICVLQQDSENRIEKMDTVSALSLIIKQTLIPKQKGEMNKLLDLLEKLLICVPVYRMGCTISKQAVEVAYNTMKQDYSA